MAFIIGDGTRYIPYTTILYDPALLCSLSPLPNGNMFLYLPEYITHINDIFQGDEVYDHNHDS